jgi:hypothetical protein
VITDCAKEITYLTEEDKYININIDVRIESGIFTFPAGRILEKKLWNNILWQSICVESTFANLFSLKKYYLIAYFGSQCVLVALLLLGFP